MIASMTGFAQQVVAVEPYGTLTVELRSTNHKFFEPVLHLPEGFLILEESIKGVIASRIKRGRITCVVSINGKRPTEISFNKEIVKRYLSDFAVIKKETGIRGEVGIDTIVHLPGVLTVEEKHLTAKAAYPALKEAVNRAVADLARSRDREGRALGAALQRHARMIERQVRTFKARFDKAIARKLAFIKNDEERTAFLKTSDVTEELQRLSYHVRTFCAKLKGSSPVGKELDFIAQEMQREANTSGAKSFDAHLSATVVRIKSLIEKIREQVQNVE